MSDIPEWLRTVGAANPSLASRCEEAAAHIDKLREQRKRFHSDIFTALRRVQSSIIKQMQAEIDGMRAEVINARSRAWELQNDLASVELERRHAVAALSEDADRFRAERDEARRMYCEAVILHGTAHQPNESGGLDAITDATELARRLRWDCFKDVTP